jgi:hypothetical protein
MSIAVKDEQGHEAGKRKNDAQPKHLPLPVGFVTPHRFFISSRITS